MVWYTFFDTNLSIMVVLFNVEAEDAFLRSKSVGCLVCFLALSSPDGTYYGVVLIATSHLRKYIPLRYSSSSSSSSGSPRHTVAPNTQNTNHRSRSIPVCCLYSSTRVRGLLVAMAEGAL